MTLYNYVRMLLILIVVLLSARLSADEVDVLYGELVDRKVSEHQIMSRFSIPSIDAEDLNKIFVSKNSVEDSVLRVSVHRRFGKIVGAILDSGASPNVRLNNNCSPLGIAIMNGDDGIVKDLISNGADTRIPVCWPQDGSTPFPIDIAITHYELSDATRLMIMRKHASIGEPLSQRILVFAIVNDNPKIAKEFIDLMPNYRNRKILDFSESRSESIHQIILNAWTVE